MKRSRRQTRSPAKRNPLAKLLRSGIYAKPRVVEPADRFVGRFAVTNERVFTAVIVPTR